MELESILKKEFPLCHIFREVTQNGLIFYDGKADFTFFVSTEEESILTEFLASGFSISRQLNAREEAIVSYLETLRGAGIFLPGPLKQVSSEDIDKIYSQILYFDENVLQRKFVLEATEDCNFRCKYCFNTLREGTSLRTHSSRKMSIETAKRAIDYYFSQYVKIYSKLSADKQQLLLSIAPPTLAWYGGETMLNFKTIVDATEYFKSLHWEEIGIPKKVLGFSTNTNMSIMPMEAIKFLVENNYQIYASLDGPKEENDKFRVLSSGAGTFDIVVKNLRKIRDYNPDYFREKVIILSVQSEGHNSEVCEKYFRDGEFAELQWMPNKEEKEGCIYTNPQETLDALKSNFVADLSEYKKLIDDYDGDENVGELLLGLIELIDVNFSSPTGSDTPELFLSCPMGIDNNMVGVDGQIHICHKSDGSYPFANIYDSPIDYKRLANLYQEYNKTINRGLCKNCWAVRHCDVCGVKRLNNKMFNNPKPIECEALRQEKHLQMSALMYAALKKPQLIEYLKIKKYEHKDYVSIIDINYF